MSMHVRVLPYNKLFLGEVLLLQSGHVKLQNLQFSVLTGHIFFFIKKKGKTELKSLCIRRLMLIDICFMKMS